MPQEIEYSAEFDFTDSIQNVWKVNRDSAVDEWVWLRNLGDYTITTSSKTPAEVFASTGVLTADTLNYGNNPARKLQDTNGYFKNVWTLDTANYISAEPQGSWSSTSWYGIKSNMSLQFGGGYGYTGYALACYGIDFLIAVNYATMQARTIWILFTNAAHTNMTILVQNSGNQQEYFSLSQFM